MRYLSEEWAKEALAVVETDERVAEATHGIQVSVLAIVLHPPEGAYGFIHVAFDGNGLSDYRVGHDYQAVTEGIADPTFVVSGEYDVFARIQAGEFSERKAILTGRLHLTGSFLKALRYMSALETIGEALRSVPCET